MKPRRNFRSNGHRTILFSTITLMTASSAHAAVWTGPGDTGNNARWNRIGNWSTNNVPTASVLAEFTGTSTGTTVDVNTANMVALGMTFSGANAYTVTNNNVTLYGSGIVNTSTALQTVSTSLALGAAASFTDNGTGSGRLLISTVDNSGNLLTLNGTALLGTISGVISGTGGLTKSGTGTWTLSGANSYSGITTIQAGTLLVGAAAPSGSNGALGNATSAVVLGNATTLAGDAPSLLINGVFTVGRDITVGSVGNANTYNATIGGSNTTGTSTFSGNITLNTTAANYTVTLRAATGGTVDFTTGTWTTNNKAIAIGSSGNTGTVKLSNVLSTTGGINVNFGTFLLGASDRLGNTTPVTVAGGILDMVGFTDSIGAFAISSGTLKLAASQTGTAQLVSGGAVSLAGTLDLTGMGTTAGIYKLVAGTSLTGTFSSTPGLNSNYLLRYGTVNANQLDAQRKANQTITGIVDLGRRLSGTTLTGVTLGTLNNTSVALSSALAVSLGSTAPGNGTITSLASSTGSTVGATLSGTITGNVNVGTTVGLQSYTLTNTDANAITTPASNSGGAVTVVNQRSFSVGTPTITLGRFLISATPGTGTTGITSSGLNAVTANATLGSFSSVNGLSLGLTSGSNIFNGAATQTANYTVSGTASAAGSVAGTFSSTVAGEFAGIPNVTVGLTGTALNQRTFSVGTPMIALGRFLISATPGSTTAISSSGLNAVTANATLNGFAAVNGLTLTTADSNVFNGASSPQIANYTIGGTASAAGSVAGTFSSSVTAELGSIANVTVGLTGTALNQRTFSVVTPTIALGRFLISATPGSTTAISSNGLNSVTANATLNGFGPINGLTLTTGDATAFNGGAASQTANYTIGGTASAAGSVAGTFSSGVTAEFGSISNVTVALTGNALNLRSVSGSVVSLGNVRSGTNLNTLTNSATFTSSGSNANTTNVLVDGTLTFDGSNNSQNKSLTGINATVAASGTYYSAAVTTLEAGLGDTYSNVAVGYTANVYSGLGVWNTNGNGNWNDFSRWTTGGGVPGLDAGFQTGQDTASFGSAATSNNPVVTLNSVSPAVSAVSLNNAGQSYTIASSGGGTLKFNNTFNSAAATLTNTAGNHTISAPIELQSNLTVTLTAGTLTTLSGVISESGGAKSLTVSGTGGTVSLSAANTFTGATIIKAGTLQLLTGGSLASSSIIVGDTGSVGAVLDAIASGLVIASGQTVSGIGTIKGSTTIQSGGAIAPGNSPGILTNLGDMTVASGSTFQAEINGLTVGTGYDQLNVTGLSSTVTLAGLLSVTTGFSPIPDSLFFLIDNDSSNPISGVFSNAPINGNTYTFGSQQYAISYFGNYDTASFTGGNDVVLMAVPEPGAALLGGIGLLCLLRRRRA